MDAWNMFFSEPFLQPISTDEPLFNDDDTFSGVDTYQVQMDATGELPKWYWLCPNHLMVDVIVDDIIINGLPIPGSPLAPSIIRGFSAEVHSFLTGCWLSVLIYDGNSLLRQCLVPLCQWPPLWALPSRYVHFSLVARLVLTCGIK